MSFKIGDYVIVKQFLNIDTDGPIDAADLKEVDHTLNKVGKIVYILDESYNKTYDIKVSFEGTTEQINFNKKELVLVKNQEHAKILYGGISE